MLNPFMQTTSDDNNTVCQQFMSTSKTNITNQEKSWHSMLLLRNEQDEQIAGFFAYNK